MGSFLNVVGLRFNSGLGIMGRSFCTVCQRQLHAIELLPIASFFFLKGRCFKCKTPISWQYPLIELWTGLIFVSIYIKLWTFAFSFIEMVTLLAYAVIFSIYVVIVIYDLRHKIIPNSLVYSTIFLGIILHIFLVGFSPLDWLAGPILFSFFGLIWLVSRGRAMGFGDAKLGLSIGLLLGFAEGFSGIVLAFWIGTAITLLYMAYMRLRSPLSHGGKRLTMKSEVPFAPFMILGAWISFVYQLDLFHVLYFANQ